MGTSPCLFPGICPDCVCVQLSSAPCAFFVFCCWERPLSGCKRPSEVSRIPVCLRAVRRFFRAKGESVSRSVVSDSLGPHGLYSPPGSSVHGILQARILEWVAISFSNGSSQTRGRTHVSDTGRWIPSCRDTWETLISVSLPGEFHGQRSLAGYTVHGVAESQIQLSMHTHRH